jgi:hypothetical protein
VSDSFYTREGERFVATPATVGPWDPRLQHGSPVASLLGTRIERAAAEGGRRVAYFSLDFLGAVPVATLDVSVACERPGKKIALFAASVAVEGRPAARASAWVLAARAGTSPEVRLDEPPPPRPETAASTYFKSVPRFGYGDALEWRFAEGHFEEIGPAAVWSRLRVAIVEGEPVSPLARVLAMVDSANGISAELDVRDYLFVPVNLTVSLARPPEGEWVGMRAVTSLAAEGVGTTRARLFDARGTIGRALQTLYVERR